MRLPPLVFPALTNNEHFLGFDEGVKGGVDNDLAAVGPAVDEVHVVQLTATLKTFFFFCAADDEAK